MGQVSIDIHELGAIKHSEITLNSIMFFSGESGLGKSYLALLCHYFFDILVDKNRLNRFFLDNQEPYNSLRDTVMKSSDSGVVLSFSKKSFEKWLAEDLKVYMRYMMNHAALACDVDIHLPGDLDEYTISYRSEITGLEGQEEISYILSLGSLSYRVGDADVIGEESHLALLMRHHLMLVIFGNYLALQSSVILPPSRGAVFTEDVKAKTGLFARFIDRMSSLRRISEFPESDNSDLLDLFRSIIQGKISTKEEEIIQRLADFRGVVEAAGEDYSPSGIANYCYELVKLYNQFYHEFQILREEDAAKRNFRLILSRNVAKVVRLGMELLGIEMPERM